MEELDSSPCLNGLHTLCLNITSACNLRCHYCYASAGSNKDRKLISLAHIDELAADAKACGAKKVVLSGGEPFFRRDWKEVFAVFDKLGYQLSVSSNGTLISEKHLEILSGIHSLMFQISLDGVEDTVDAITGVRGSYNRAISAINRLQRRGFSVQLNYVLHEANYDDLPFIIRYSYDRRIFTRITVVSTFYGRAKTSVKSIPLQQLVRVIRAIHVARTVNPFIELNLPPLLLPLEDWFPISPSCGWVRHQCGVLSNGDVTICGLAIDQPQLVAGNIALTRFKEIWRDSHLFGLLRNLSTASIRGVCAKCPFLQYCGGSCRLTPYLSEGDYYAPDGLCQKYHDALLKHEIAEHDFPSGVVECGLMGL
jgi:radical SAM protein with 4Fe4S-binding SPASM domain